MKFIFGFCFLVFPIFCTAHTDQNLLNKSVRFQTEIITVEQILNELSIKYQILLSYEPQKMPLQNEVKLPQKEMRLKEVLETISRSTGITYTVRSNVIILTWNSQSEKQDINEEKSCSLRGFITEKTTGKPLAYVTIYMPGLNKGTVSDTNGKYQIPNIIKGVYEIRFSFMGYKEVVKHFQISSNTTLNVTMEEAFTELEAVTVTPGTYNISATEPTMSTLSSKEILLSPNFAKDINRTLRVIPGFANNDLSAKPRIRGGHWNETAIYIDNFEIYEPYHFEEINGLASIFNADYARDIKISTGGFSAKYTDKMSGIIEVKTPDYVTKNQHNASIDFLNATVYGKMRIKDKVSVLYGIRSGYLDLIMKDLNADVSPVYNDIWAKVNYEINRKNTFSVNILKAKNDFLLKVESNYDANFYFHNIKNNNYGWINWKWLPYENYYV